MIILTAASLGAFVISLSAGVDVAQQTHASVTLANVLERVGGYVDRFADAVSAVVARESYQQVVRGAYGQPANASRYAVNAPASRSTIADLLVLRMDDVGWVAFRDVYEVDGRPVRDHDERLAKLFAEFQPGSIEAARSIAVESARYNLNAGRFKVDRTINTPLTALLFLMHENQPRSKFILDDPERVRDVECIVLRFTEEATPRLIGTGDGAAARGAFWLDPTSGRVVRSELELRSTVDVGGGEGEQLLSAKLRVDFDEVPRVNFWLPAEMHETYEIRPGTEVIVGHAEYSSFRQFNVTTGVEVQ